MDVLLDVFNVLSIPGEHPWMQDIESGSITPSRKLETLIGLPNESGPISRDAYLEFVKPDHRQRLEHALHAVADGAVVLDVKYPLITLNKREIWVHDRGHALVVEPGSRQTLLVGALRDISERRAAFNKLQISEQRFRDLARNVPGAIFRYVIYPDGRDEIEYMSPGCVDLWEIDAESLQQDPTPLWEMVDPEHLPEMQQSVMLSAQTLTPWLHIWRILTPSGTEKWLRGSAQPQRRDDGSTLWNSLILDITEEKKRELDAAEARYAAEEANQAKSRFLASVSHELRTPLNAIIGYSEVIDNGIFGQIAPEKYREYINDILASGQYLKSLIDDLLDFSQMELYAKSLPLEAVDLREAIEDALRFRDFENQDRIAVDFTDVPVANANMRGTRQIIINLLNNALSYSRDKVQVRTFVKNGKPAFEVSDRGAGMSEVELSRAEEPFYRGKENIFVAKGGPGVGIGLTIVKNIIEAMRASYEIESEIGRGTTVRVYLNPLEQTAAVP